MVIGKLKVVKKIVKNLKVVIWILKVVEYNWDCLIYWKVFIDILMLLNEYIMGFLLSLWDVLEKKKGYCCVSIGIKI